MESEEVGTTVVEEISTNNLMDERHIGWVQYREGDALLRAKVVRGKNQPFISHVTAYKKGCQCSTVDYPNRGLWRMKEKVLLDAFRYHVGDEAYFNSRQEYAAEGGRPIRHSF